MECFRHMESAHWITARRDTIRRPSRPHRLQECCEYELLQFRKSAVSESRRIPASSGTLLGTHDPPGDGRSNSTDDPGDLESRRFASEEFRPYRKDKVRVEDRPAERFQSHTVHGHCNQFERVGVWSGDKHRSGSRGTAAGAVVVLRQKLDLLQPSPSGKSK